MITCDACGAGLADVPFESMDEINRDQMAEEKKDQDTERRGFIRQKHRMIVTAIVVTLLGICAIILGIYLFIQGSNLYALISLLTGFAILFFILGMDPIGVRRYGAIFGRSR